MTSNTGSVLEAQKFHLYKMGRTRANNSKTEAGGAKDGGVEKKVGGKSKGSKQASITGFLMTQREPLGEIGNHSVERVEEEKIMLDDNLEKEKVQTADVKNEVEKEDPEMDGLCEYEKIRMRNIRQREALFAELALQVFSSTCALHYLNQ